MKRIKKLISMFLVMSICLSFFGCEYVNELIGVFGEQTVEEDPIKGGMNGNHSIHDLFPDGYTGGFLHNPGENVEYWWVETYDECVDAIKLLKSHGSTFSDEMILAYDGDEFDTKYCFTITGVGWKTEKIKWGDNPFDRHAENVSISSYAFFDDVTIDKINHSYLHHFNAYSFYMYDKYPKIISNCKEDDIFIGEWIKNDNMYSESGKCVLKVYYHDQVIFGTSTTFMSKE